MNIQLIEFMRRYQKPAIKSWRNCILLFIILLHHWVLWQQYNGHIVIVILINHNNGSRSFLIRNEVAEIKGTSYILFIIDHQEYLLISEKKLMLKCFIRQRKLMLGNHNLTAHFQVNEHCPWIVQRPAPGARLIMSNPLNYLVLLDKLAVLCVCFLIKTWGC